MKISTLHELVEWFISNCPRKVIIGKRSKLRQIKEFNPANTNNFWRFYRGVKVLYL